MALRGKKEKKEAHIHAWQASGDASYQVCVCKSVLISEAEFFVRRKFWDTYYDAVRKSLCFKRFVMQKDAMKNGNLALVRQLAAEARAERLVKKDWIKPPPFPDTNWGGYVVQ